MESNITPNTQYTQVTVDVPEDRVAEFHAFFARFLAGRADAGVTDATAVTVTVSTAAVAVSAASAPRAPSGPRRAPKRLRSDGRQAGHGGRTRGAGAGVLRLVRAVPCGRAGHSAPVRRSRSPWPARHPPARRRRPAWSAGGRRTGGLALPEAGAAGARVVRHAADSPGARVGGEQVARQLGLDKGAHGVAGILAWPGRYSRHLGRVLPIATEGRADGGTDYYMDPETAALFKAARERSSR